MLINIFQVQVYYKMKTFSDHKFNALHFNILIKKRKVKYCFISEFIIYS